MGLWGSKVAFFQHITTRFDGDPSYVSGVSGLAFSGGTGQGAGAGRIFSINGAQGGILGRDLAQTLAVTQQLGAQAPGPAGRAAPAGLQVTTLEGRAALLSYGDGPGVQGYWLDSAGAVSGSFNLPVGNATTALATTVLALQTMALAGGGDMLFVSSLQNLGVSCWQRLPGGGLLQQQQLVGEGGVLGYDVLAMAVAQVGAQALLLTVSAQSDCLTAYRIDARGQAVLAATLRPADGLAVAAPNLVKTVHLAGGDFALLGAAGTSSITVVRLGADGSMAVMDQVNDDLNTRFQGISVLDCVTVQGRVFVVAGGADDGLSLMELLPNGRLLHLETLADRLDIALQDVSALTLRAQGDHIDVFVTGWSETGLSQFRIDPGPLAAPLIAPEAGGVLSGAAAGDLLMGGEGRDRLYGGAGDDILIDGLDVDALYGGAGADVFVFLPDDARDEVRDFTVGIDRLDLSGLGRIYSRDAIGFLAMAGGIELRVAGDKILLFSADGQTIRADQLSDGDLFGLSHVAPVVMLDPGRLIAGSALADMLLGKSGNDRMFGGAGADVLQGGDGADTLNGESIDTLFDPVAAQVYRLYRATLNREPDAAGQVGWTQRIVTGAVSFAQAITGFVSSREFQNHYGAADDSAFVTLLYNNVLGRSPDASGFATWLAALSSGAKTRDAVVAGFSESREFVRSCETGGLNASRAALQADWADDVFRLYRATLDRAPDIGGLINWSAALAQGRSFLDVVQGFVSSREFQNLYGATDDAAFVTLLYHNVLERSPDAAGFAMWTQRLALGLSSRAELVAGFAQSREFITAQQQDMLEFMRSAAVGDRAGDHLDGGVGDNLLFGGLGADTFVFDQSVGGSQRVADLERWDTIALRGFGYASAAEAMVHLHQSRCRSGVRRSGQPDQLSQHHIGRCVCRYVLDLKPPQSGSFAGPDCCKNWASLPD